MKKVILAVVVMIATVSMSNAQMFVGGGLGVDFSGGKLKGGSATIDAPSTFSFEFTPKLGFYLSSDFAVGVQVGLSSSSTKTPKEYSYYLSDDMKETTFGWELGVFARKNVLGTEKLSLLLEGLIGVGGSKPKTKVGSETTDDDSTFSFGISFLPVLEYSLTDKLSLEMSCDFLRLGFSSSTVTDADDSNNKATSTSFGLGVNAGTLPLSWLNLGIIYKF